MTADRPRKQLKRSGATLAVVVLFVFAALGIAGVATSTPKSCASCHTMRPFTQSLAKSTHAGVHCYRCHAQGGVWGVPQQKLSEWGPMLAGSLTGKDLQGQAQPISSQRCLSCHAAVMQGVVSANGTRINHQACVQAPAQCTDCHSGVAHGPAVRWPTAPVMEECVKCHALQSAPTDCDTCHRGRREKERLVVGPWQVTHGKQWRTTHGQADLAYCGTCHPADYCVDCHGTSLPHGADFGRTHGAEALRRDAQCLSCHQKLLCEACHGLPMPHPTGFLKVHSSVAEREGEPACTRCHVQDDCEACHTAHVHPGRTDGTLGTGPDGSIRLPQPKSGGRQ